MNNLYKLVILVLLCSSTSLLLDAQEKRKISFWQSEYPKNMLYGKYKELDICNCIDSCFCQDNNSDTLFFVRNYPIFIPKIKTEWEKEVEYFEPRDTLARMTLIVYGKEYVIDTLIGMKSTDYTGAYYLSNAFSTFYGKKEYILLRFFDGYQLGSDVQGIYVIFELNARDARFCASYIENNNYRSSKVCIVKKKDGVYLKSKNLDRWK